MEVGSLIEKYRPQLKALNGSVDLIAGGPPCQGFSIGGARRGHDERNELVFDYLEFLSILVLAILDWSSKVE